MGKGYDTLDLYPMAQSMAQNYNVPIKKVADSQRFHKISASAVSLQRVSAATRARCPVWLHCKSIAARGDHHAPSHETGLW